MHLGYFMMPLHHADSAYHQTLQDDVEAVVYADELGFTEAWVGEHYSAAVEQITSPLLFHANLIARTKQIKFATGVMCLPQYHPAVIAGQAAMFDHLSQGRFIMGVGPGGLPSDFELFGVMGQNRTEMVEESLQQILALWTTDPPYQRKGKYWSSDMTQWTHHDIKMGYVPKPLQQPHPPIAMSAMSPSSGSIRYAGAHGYMPVSANFIAEWVLKTHWPTYLAGAASTGYTPKSADWHVARSIFVADTDAQAEAFVRAPGGAYDYYFDYLFKIFDRTNYRAPFVAREGDDPRQLDHQQIRDACVIYGSPETVAAKLLGLRDRVGDFGTLLYAAHDWQDRTAMRHSMRLMAEEVMPRINQQIAKAA